MGAAFAAIGIAASAWTRHQVVAFLVSMTLCLVPWLVGYMLARFPAASTPIVQYFSFQYHFANLATGVIDTRSLVFYGGVVVVGLMTAQTALEWRRLS
jgi:ABC-2 type transport system permease protein